MLIHIASERSLSFTRLVSYMDEPPTDIQLDLRKGYPFIYKERQRNLIAVMVCSVQVYR